MTALHVTFSLLCATAAFAAGSYTALAQRTAIHDEAGPPGTISFESDVVEPAAPTRRMPDRIDLRGNPIDHAIGDYRVDPQGGTYEAHSPNTVVARPGPSGA
jgi:hypothetical protein